MLIFFGAGLGGVLRYGVSNLVYLWLGKLFPYGTLIVNVSGCLLMGFLFEIIFQRFAEMSAELRALLLIGFLGGYTTFSSFSIETLNLFENGNTLAALVNIFLSIIFCLIAVWIGVIGARNI